MTVSLPPRPKWFTILDLTMLSSLWNYLYVILFYQLTYGFPTVGIKLPETQQMSDAEYILITLGALNTVGGFPQN